MVMSKSVEFYRRGECFSQGIVMIRTIEFWLGFPSLAHWDISSFIEKRVTIFKREGLLSLHMDADRFRRYEEVVTTRLPALVKEEL